jgi:hypothetical protein
VAVVSSRGIPLAAIIHKKNGYPCPHSGRIIFRQQHDD